GAGVGRGYLRDAARTAESYVPDPFSGEGGERLYRTGDVVKYSKGGELEYVGRADSQVKVRGYRIELGEVEAALREQAGVKEAVVVAREEGEGEKRLVGYVVMEGTQGEMGAEAEAQGERVAEAEVVRALREGIGKRLPEYMIPQALVVLREMPLTPNGKINRRALPAPDYAKSISERTYVAPRNETEKVVAEIWAEVLGASEIGVEDNFFSIGGHSLLATQVVSRLRQRLTVEIRLRTLFESPTIAALALAIDSVRGQQAQPETPAITARSRGKQSRSELMAKLQGLSEAEARQLLKGIKNAKLDEKL
ncbi:MAG: phosphopantetheine-binding protein, partial [Acidobacteria bacterium]|nr:phosphopantetheine-binding protein [Acidobacteriota bacterium]